MAVHLRYDAELELLLMEFEGDLADSDLTSAFKLLQGFAATHRIRRGVLDGTRVQHFAITAETVQRLAQTPTMFPADSDRCIVVRQDYLYGMARMYQMLGGDSRERLRVVRTLDEAYDHLKITPPKNLQLMAP